MRENENQTPEQKAEKRKTVTGKILYWVLINLGTLLVAVGVVLFKAPNSFATGGVSGVSIILSKFITPINSFTEKFLTQSIIMWIINVLLLIVGFIFLGKGCTFKTAYCTIVYNLEAIALEAILKAANVSLPLTNQIFLEFVLAMLLTGAGSAIIFNCKASTGGTDIVALIIKKYTNVKNIGIALLISDLLIAASAFFTFDVQAGLYSILGLFAKSFLIDGVIESIGKNKSVTIITSKPELIAEYILDKMHRGYTSYKAIGGYTGEEKTIMLCIVKRSEALKLKTKIHQADPSSFVIFTDTSEILGKGFHTFSD